MRSLNLMVLSLLLCSCQYLSQAPDQQTIAAGTVIDPSSNSCHCEPATPVAAVCSAPPVKHAPPSCSKVATVPPQANAHMFNDRLIIGRVETVLIAPEKIKLKARIDTGAGISSLHASNLIEFERDGKDWVKFTIPTSKTESIALEQPVKRFVAIKQHSGEPQRRPVVLMSLTLGPIHEQIEMTLTDRSDYLYDVLIGRNFLRDRAIVDVSKKFRIKPPTH